jgi:hypothetical protein
MAGDDPTGGDNQQGRPPGCELTPDYVAGFVDGEGCFSVSVHPHPTVRYGTRWLIAPSFQVSQHRDSVRILEDLQRFFGCGRVATKGPMSRVMTFVVYRRRDLETVIIPFFERHTLRSEKRKDFERFARVVRLMESKAHRTDEGFRTIIETAFSMNRNGKQRRYRLEDVLAEPSETVRRAPLRGGGDETVRPPWRHGEGGRNDRPAAATVGAEVTVNA